MCADVTMPHCFAQRCEEFCIASPSIHCQRRDCEGCSFCKPAPTKGDSAKGDSTKGDSTNKVAAPAPSVASPPSTSSSPTTWRGTPSPPPPIPLAGSRFASSKSSTVSTGDGCDAASLLTLKGMAQSLVDSQRRTNKALYETLYPGSVYNIPAASPSPPPSSDSRTGSLYSSPPPPDTSCIVDYAQCGGQSYAGDEACCSGLTCVVHNLWWHSCRAPGTY